MHVLQYGASRSVSVGAEPVPIAQTTQGSAGGRPSGPDHCAIPAASAPAALATPAASAAPAVAPAVAPESVSNNAVVVDPVEVTPEQ